MIDHEKIWSNEDLGECCNYVSLRSEKSKGKVLQTQAF
jgi:hypothetical protein